MLEVMPRLALSRAAGAAAGLTLPRPLRRPVYGTFATAFGARLDEAAHHLESYESFNAFFTRPLRAGMRPDLGAAAGWVSPADGRLDQFGRIDDGQLVQAKGMTFRVSELLQDPDGDAVFDGGLFATVYLSPADYHRVHAPCAMEVDEVVHAGGDLYPVNGLSVPYKDGLFARNERVVMRFRDPAGRRAALVMVGAVVVGGIELANGLALRSDHREALRRVPLSPPWSPARLDEVGTFLLGSTVVLVVERGEPGLRPVASAALGAPVRIGEPLFELVAGEG